MIERQLQPGNKVWVINRYQNTVKELMIAEVKLASGHVRFEREISDTSLGLLFETRDEAVDGLIARARNEITKAENDLNNRKKALYRLERKLLKTLNQT